MPSAPPDTAVDQFRRAIAGLIDAPDAARFGVAVSGGPDSMALLLLAAAAFPGRVEAATVDHGLRVEAAQEAAMVARCCEALRVPHATLKPAQPITGSLQAAARGIRYALLESWRADRAIDWLMTAHHADDQLETMLMRLNRGSGVGGLSGVRGRNGAVLRPLLDWRKADLVTLATEAGMPFALDPSNHDPRFDRAAMRAALAGADWLDPVAAGRSAAALAQADTALDWMTARLADERIEADAEGVILRDADVPPELQRRLVLRMLRQADPAALPPRGEALDGALEKLRAGEKTSLGHWLLEGGKQWTLRRAPPRRSAT